MTSPRLSGTQITEIQALVGQAFNESTLDQFVVKHGLGASLAHLVDVKQPLGSIIHDLIVRLDREGTIEDLLRSLVADRRERPEFSRLLERHARWKSLAEHLPEATSEQQARVHDCYLRASPKGWTSLREPQRVTAAECAWVLMAAMPRGDGLVPVLSFVRGLRVVFPVSAEAFRSWENDFIARESRGPQDQLRLVKALDDEEARGGRGAGSESPVVVVHVAPGRTTGRYRARAWFFSALYPRGEPLEDECELDEPEVLSPAPGRAEGRLESFLTACREAAAGLLPGNVAEARMEFFLPLELLGSAVDRRSFRHPLSGELQALGDVHAVIVRCTDRFQHRSIRGAIQERYQAVAAALDACAVVETLLGEEAIGADRGGASSRRLWARLRDAVSRRRPEAAAGPGVAALRLASVPMGEERVPRLQADRRIGCILIGPPIRAEEREQFRAKLVRIIETGVPLVLWVRTHPDAAAADLSTTLGRLIKGRRLIELPNLLRELRSGTRFDPLLDPMRRDLTLLFDYPDRLPPELAGREVPASGPRAPRSPS